MPVERDGWEYVGPDGVTPVETYRHETGGYVVRDESGVRGFTSGGRLVAQDSGSNAGSVVNVMEVVEARAADAGAG